MILRISSLLGKIKILFKQKYEGRVEETYENMFKRKEF